MPAKWKTLMTHLAYAEELKDCQAPACDRMATYGFASTCKDEPGRMRYTTRCDQHAAELATRLKIKTDIFTQTPRPVSTT